MLELPLRQAACAFALALAASAVAVACADGNGTDASGSDASTSDGDAAAAPSDDAAAGDASAHDGGALSDGSTSPNDGATFDAGGADAGTFDASTHDASSSDSSAADSSTNDSGTADSGAVDSGGILTGGPCLSGAPGATAFRARWLNANGQAYPSYEAFGLPDHSRDKIGAYGYQIGFTPSYVDPYLAVGGVALDSSDFLDIELSTVGLSSITSATIAIYGRSYDVSTSGSFNWQTFVGTGTTPTDFVSNVAPYQWYTADFLTEINPGDGNVLIRIKAGPSSDSLVVSRVEICLQAN